MTTARRSFRLDIQVLRGVAVLLVLLYHAGIAPFKAGYLGVDVFFVISGFLITGMIASAVDQSSFSLREFYARRIRRLLPAAYVTLAVTLAAAPFFLDADLLHKAYRTILGAVTFTANIVLWRQGGYFSSTAELNPLLHFWSLAIEEQYYLFAPLGLMVLGRRWRVPVVALAVIVSLALCLHAAAGRPGTAFYLLPFRAWELGLGSLGALLLGTRGALRSPRIVFGAAWAALILIPILPTPFPHPGVDALIVCIATLIIILQADEGALTRRWTRPFSRLLKPVGDISYSLYLVHWPLLAFLANAYLEPPPLAARLAALAAALALAVLMYRFVEQPIQTGRIRADRRFYLVVAGVTATLIGACAVAIAITPRASAGQGPNLGLGAACNYTGAFQPRAECMIGPDPQVMVWGDSYAMHLLPGMAEAAGSRGVIQATRSDCGPFLGLGILSKEHSRAAAESCMAFNRSVLAYVAVTPTIRTVVLSSPFLFYAWERGPDYRLLTEDGRIVAPGPETAAADLRRLIAALRAKGKTVVIVAPPPSTGVDIGRCLVRKAEGKLLLGAPSDCSLDRSAYIKNQAPVLDFLDIIEETVPVARISIVTCGATRCATRMNGTNLYVDGGHLTPQGSRMLAEIMRWDELLAPIAPPEAGQPTRPEAGPSARAGTP